MIIPAGTQGHSRDGYIGLPKGCPQLDTPNLETSLHILTNAPMGIVITDSAGKILWLNKRMDSWLGGVSKAYLGKDEASLVENGSDDFTLNSGPYQMTSGRILLRSPLSAINGQQAICYLDVSEQESLRQGRTLLAEQLEQHATVEPISGLLNERAISAELESLVTRSRRYNNPLTVVTMEITTLDTIAENIGQVAIDKIIVSVSQLLRDQMRWADLLGRLDSGHFIFILPEIERDDAEALAKKIISRLRKLQIKVDDNVTVIPEVCFGIVEWSKGEDANKLLLRAMGAMNVANQDGPYNIHAG